jgi:hypothetical protein
VGRGIYFSKIRVAELFGLRITALEQRFSTDLQTGRGRFEPSVDFTVKKVMTVSIEIIFSFLFLI